MLQLPAHIQLELTDTCNLRCSYCYHFDTDEMPKSVDLNNDKILQLVQKLVKAKIYSLVITGGEPLTRSLITTKIVQIAKKAGIFVSINTNLLLFTSDIAKQLKQAKLDSILVSCPASNEIIYKKMTSYGNYKQLRSKLILLVDSGISFMVNMVVTSLNHRFIKSTATDMARLGVKRFAATPVSLNVEHPNYQELLNKQQTITLLEDLRWCTDKLGLKVDILEPLPKCVLPNWCWEKEYAFTKRTCQAGRMSVSISNTGDVRPCSHNPNIYGNLFKETLKNIWTKMDIYRNGVVPTACKHCPTVSSCNGACRTNSLAITGSLDKPDRFMVGPINLLPKQKNKIFIGNNQIIHFKGRLRWRPEFKNYSISSKNNGGNLMVVNKEMFNFVYWLEKNLPLSTEELIKNKVKNSMKNYFIKIIKILIKREFLYLV